MLQEKQIVKWCEPDEKTREQAHNVASLPFLVGHFALMADGHSGYGMPIGGVAALDGVVCPNMVGADIGCGMHAFKTGMKIDEFSRHREEVLDMIFEQIPVGTKWHESPQYPWHLAKLLVDVPARLESMIPKIELQLGTLGSGNHFIELQVAEDDDVWVMLHSGSRNLGKKVGEYYNDVAKTLNKEYWSEVPKEWDLAFLPFKHRVGTDYWREMNFCLYFAQLNRLAMAATIRNCLGAVTGVRPPVEYCDIHHNYAAFENHYGKNVIVHRKGAVKALGVTIVPGCMETASYICEGIPNRNSFNSHSHGAGRTMGRREACRQIKAETVTERLKRLDISIRKPELDDIAEESRESYKEIASVMEAQTDLLMPIVKLRPIGVIKG